MSQHNIRVSQLSEDGVHYVRVHIIDPDGKDGRWINLVPANALIIGEHITSLAKKCLATKPEKPSNEGT